MPSLNTGNAILSNPIKVDSSYNVGIGGAASGSFKLEVTGTGNFTGALSGTSATFSGALEAGKLGGAVTVGDLFVDSANNSVYVGRQSSTSGDNSKFYVRNRVNTLTALSVDPGGNGAVDVVGTFSTTRGTNLATATGDVGIGNATPATKLDVTGTIRPIGQTDPTSGVGMELFYRAADTSSYIQSYDRTNSAWKDVRIYGNTLYFGSQGTNNLTITSGGNVGINTSTPSSFGNYTNVTIKGGSSGANLDLYNSANTRSANFVLNGTASAYIGTVNDIPFDITQNDVTRIRVASGGNVGIGISNPSRKFVVVASTAGSVAEILNERNNSSGDFCFVTALGANANNTNSYHYIATTGGADKFYVYGNGTYTTVSDRRLKKNISKVTDTYLDKVLALNIVNYNWNEQEDGHPLEFGMIAQEVEELIPSIVHEGREQEDGNIYKGIQSSVLPYILIKAIQELNQTIQNQQQQINSLINR
jgi:hypothetical protein